jgi:hypothetical protein
MSSETLAQIKISHDAWTQAADDHVQAVQHRYWAWRSTVTEQERSARISDVWDEFFAEGLDLRDLRREPKWEALHERAANPEWVFPEHYLRYQDIRCDPVTRIPRPIPPKQVLPKQIPPPPPAPVTPKVVRPPEDQYLYRLYADDGALLYVGVTYSLAVRFAQHAGTQPWWHEVAHHEAVIYPSRGSVARAEALAIRDENPRYNKAQPRVEDESPNGDGIKCKTRKGAQF